MRISSTHRVLAVWVGCTTCCLVAAFSPSPIMPTFAVPTATTNGVKFCSTAMSTPPHSSAPTSQRRLGRAGRRPQQLLQERTRCWRLLATGENDQNSSVKNDDNWEVAEVVEGAYPIVPTTLEAFLSKKFPEFLFLLQKNDQVMEVVRGGNNNDDDYVNDNPNAGITLFCPNAEAFENLGSTRRAQLEDERNVEAAAKMAAYHVIANEAVAARRLSTEDWTRGRPAADGSAFTVEGIQTVGGLVPVGRSRTDQGLLGTGWFAKQNGRAAVIGTNNARIVRSYAIGGGNASDDDKAKPRRTCLVHEVDGLISPELLWRFCDQLRIPGF